MKLYTYDVTTHLTTDENFCNTNLIIFLIKIQRYADRKRRLSRSE